MLNLASLHPDFHFHPKCRIHGIHHLTFDDDILLLSRRDLSSVMIFLQQLNLFAGTSGPSVNLEKSSIYFGGVRDCTKEAILQATRFKVGSFPFKYLRVPLSPHRFLASQVSLFLHKLESVVQCWMGKHLSYAGRLELLMFVLHGVVFFWLSIFPFPATVINQITCICRNFLWSGNISSNKSAMVSWKTVCLS